MLAFQVPRSAEERSPAPDYVEDELFTREAPTVFQQLRDVDWAFGADDTRFLASRHSSASRHFWQLPAEAG